MQKTLVLFSVILAKFAHFLQVTQKNLGQGPTNNQNKKILGYRRQRK